MILFVSNNWKSTLLPHDDVNCHRTGEPAECLLSGAGDPDRAGSATHLTTFKKCLKNYQKFPVKNYDLSKIFLLLPAQKSI